MNFGGLQEVGWRFPRSCPVEYRSNVHLTRAWTRSSKVTACEAANHASGAWGRWRTGL